MESKFILGLEFSELTEDKLINPKDPIEDGETVLGELSLELKKLYTLWVKTGTQDGASVRA
jgi:hypothetical protein